MPQLLGGTDLRLGNAARLFCPPTTAWFIEICARLGISGAERGIAVEHAGCKITAITGATLERSPTTTSTPLAAAMTTAYADRRRDRARAAPWPRNSTGCELTLFHAGSLTTLRLPAPHPPAAVTGWATVAPGFTADRAPLRRAESTVSLRPNTVRHIEHDLRQFGTWLADTHPEVTAAQTCTANTSKRSKRGCRPTPRRPPANRSTGSASRTR